jgi:hypothetical protein
VRLTGTSRTRVSGVAAEEEAGAVVVYHLPAGRRAVRQAGAKPAVGLVVPAVAAWQLAVVVTVAAWELSVGEALTWESSRQSPLQPGRH